jgi:peptidoglycan hydrolase-like protein with peptidoglycan-binding domain
MARDSVPAGTAPVHAATSGPGTRGYGQGPTYQDQVETAHKAAYDKSKHPHVGKGSPTGGQFARKGAGGGGSRTAPRRGSVPAAAGSGGGSHQASRRHTMRLGDRGSEAAILNARLNWLGLGTGSLDTYNEKTADAIKQVQRRLGLRATGRASAQLQDTIRAVGLLSPCRPVAGSAEEAVMGEPVSAAGVEYAHTKAEHYADPGYQPDGKKRYALDSESECRAAWSYISQADNAAKYTPEQLARVKARIKAAGKKYGIQFADEVHAAAEVAAAADLHDVELARTGAWKLSTGPLQVTPRMLDDVARFAARDGARPAPIKLGHKDQRFAAAGDGEPAMGWVSNVRVEQDAKGHVLKGSLTGLPDWLAKAIPTHWPDRSIEGWADYSHEGQKYGLVMSALALLGVTPPGMSSIASLRDLPAAVGVAAGDEEDPPEGAIRVIASFGPQTPAPTKAGPPKKKESGMDPAKFREALGLDAEDFSDEDIIAALAEAGSDDPAPVAAGAPTVAADEASGVIRIEASAFAQMQDEVNRLKAVEKRRRADERDAVITQAIQDGRFAPARREHWQRLWDLDPEGTRASIASLQRNLIPVMASGYAGGDGGEVEQDELDREIERLSPPKGKVA